MVKSITAMAVGLAVQQGLVDEQAPVSTYLPRFAEGDNASLTVQELLQMRSNIPFGEDYKDPFGFQAKAYYRDDNRTLLEPYRVDGDPGTVFKYQGGNTMLLAEILDAVREGNLSQDIANGLWEQMGARHDAFWGLDGDPADGAVERAFAQYYATTRDYARFGQMLLDSGAWKGQQLLDKGYVTRMITPVNQLAPTRWRRPTTGTRFGWARRTTDCRSPSWKASEAKWSSPSPPSTSSWCAPATPNPRARSATCQRTFTP